jgi:hypothetical protein
MTNATANTAAMALNSVVVPMSVRPIRTCPSARAMNVPTSEIFLYAWPPLRRRRELFRRLADANVALHADVLKMTMSLGDEQIRRSR